MLFAVSLLVVFNMAGREARRNDERLYFKFFVKYFENLHKDLHDKAMNLYEETKKLNPNVKDLTKTAQFMAVVTPGLPVPRYYHHRQLKADITRQIQGGPRMVLQIPLRKQQPHQPSPSAAPCIPSPPPPVPHQPSPSAAPCIPSPPPPVPHQPSPSAAACIPSPPAPVPSQSAPVPAQPAPLLMPDSTFQQLLTELLKDPNLEQIMNNFPFSNDNDDMNPFVQDDDMNPFVQDDVFMMDDTSPLETELLNTY